MSLNSIITIKNTQFLLSSLSSDFSGGYRHIELLVIPTEKRNQGVTTPRFISHFN